jgi:hypothetical protein
VSRQDTSGPGDRFRVVPERLGQVATALDGLAGALTAVGRAERSGASAEKAAGSLSGWRLEGALRDVSRTWHHQLDTLVRTVGASAQSLRSNAAAYTGTEQTNDQLVRGPG